jgi:UDP-glucose 4-epimerase
MGDFSRLSRTRLKALVEYYRDLPVLVAGADGFLGYNCVLMLRELGADVSVLSRRRESRAGAEANRTFIADLRDSENVRAAVKGQSVVFDFAGAFGAVESNQNPLRNLEEDCRPQLNLFEACSESNAMVVFCSSRLVYGKPQHLPVNEESKVQPQSMYAAHKLASELHLSVLAQTRGLRCSILRLSNPYGPHQEAAQKSYGIINQFIRTACSGHSIRIYGDGLQKRDYIYVTDAVLAFLLCPTNNQCEGQILNLGGRRAVSIVEAAELISSLAGGPPIHFEPWPKNYKTVETGDYWTDLEKLDRLIDLPEMLSFNEGVQRSVDFYKLSAPVSRQSVQGAVRP